MSMHQFNDSIVISGIIPFDLHDVVSVLDLGRVLWSTNGALKPDFQLKLFQCFRKNFALQVSAVTFRGICFVNASACFNKACS